MKPNDHEPDHLPGEPMPGTCIMTAAIVGAFMWAVVLSVWML